MNTDDEKKLLMELAGRLEKQIELARHGSFGKLLHLTSQCEPLVEKITAAGLFKKPEHKVSLGHLAELYKNLQLLLLAQQNAVAEQLKLIGKGKKTLAIYHNSI
jgi:hypothetical protein